MKRNMVNEVGNLLKKHRLSIAFAESATAGRLCSEFSIAENAGSFLKGAVCCYDASIKETLLGVDSNLIKTFTPESMEVTRAIAFGLAKIIPADFHIGVTGLTCPGGSETGEKPVGTMFVFALYKGMEAFSQRFDFNGPQKAIIDATVENCVLMLRGYLELMPSDTGTTGP